MNLGKSGTRVLAVAESFSGRRTSTLAGLVMRKDLRIDGFAVTRITVGGMDATEGVMHLFRELDRCDINVIMLSGAVIAWFNVIDPEHLVMETGLPVICVTYEDSEGLGPHILHHFPDDEARLKAYGRLGERTSVLMRSGHTAFVRSWGIPVSEASVFCRQLTYDGKIPEPLRAARILARGIMRLGNGGISPGRSGCQ
jgi:uncharacterized protein